MAQLVNFRIKHWKKSFGHSKTTFEWQWKITCELQGCTAIARIRMIINLTNSPMENSNSRRYRRLVGGWFVEAISFVNSRIKNVEEMRQCLKLTMTDHELKHETFNSGLRVINYYHRSTAEHNVSINCLSQKQSCYIINTKICFPSRQ